MFRIILTAGIGLAAAMFGPYLFYSAAEHWEAARQSLPSLGSASSPSSGNVAGTADPDADSTNQTTDQPEPQPLAGPPVMDFAEVFRFDVGPRWVVERWPRVITGLAQLQLSGHRVPLVTGTQPSDLAGALTYYFDTAQRVRRITFRGTTGDPSRLITFLGRRYKFTHQPVNDPALFIYRAVDHDGQFAGSVEIRPAWQVNAAQPYRRYQVKLQLERPLEG